MASNLPPTSPSDPGYSIHTFIDRLVGHRLTLDDQDWFFGHPPDELWGTPGLERYVKTLCDFILDENADPINIAAFGLVLLKFVRPARPTLEEADLLVGLLHTPHTGKPLIRGVLSVLQGMSIPAGTDPAPLLALLEGGKKNYENECLDILAGFQDKPARNYLIGELRSYTGQGTRIGWLLPILGEQLNFWAVPLIMEHLLWIDREQPIPDEVWAQAGTVVVDTCRTFGWPVAMSHELVGPAFWSAPWQGTKEDFVGFASRCAVDVEDDYLDEIEHEDDIFRMTDWVGDTLIRELSVDISPYRKFRELRMCSDFDIRESLKAEKVKMAGILAVHRDLAGTGVAVDGGLWDHMRMEFRNVFYAHRLKRYLNSRTPS